MTSTFCTPAACGRGFFAGHRVLAPPPAPNGKLHRKRSLFSSSDSPPKCRRKLFDDDDDNNIVDIPSPQTILPSPTTTLDYTTIHAWTAAMTHLKTSSTRSDTLINPLTNVLQSDDAALIGAAVPVLARIAGAITPTSALLSAVFVALTRHIAHKEVVVQLVEMLCRHDWARLYPVQVADASTKTVHVVIDALNDDDRTPDMTVVNALLSLLWLIMDAANRALEHTEPPAALVGAVLHAFERLIMGEDAHMMLDALRTLSRMVRDDALCRRFAGSKMADLLAEVASEFRECLPVQQLCVNVLVRLANSRKFMKL